MTSTSATRVRELNVAFRTTTPGAGQWMLTPGVSAEGLTFCLLAMKAVREFRDFTDGNDPYGEHDFGAFNLAGETLFWKIDYYDLSLCYGSQEPADPAVTRRILTIMLASEY